MKQKMAKEPLYKQIKTHLNALIEQNLHNPKYRLPSENRLASQFGTSRIPVIQAMRELEEEGKIIRVQGSGSFISAVQSEQHAPQMRFAVLLPQIKSHFCNEILTGIKDFLDTKGIMLHVCVTGDDPEQEMAYIDSIRSMHFHGIFLFPVLRSTYSNAILKLAISKFPVVFIGRNMPHLDVSSILCDPFDQIFRAVEHLYNKGHKKIVFITESSTDEHFYKKRCQGFKAAIQFFLQDSEPRIAEMDFFSNDDNNQEKIEKQIINFLDENNDADAIITTDLASSTIAKHLIKIGAVDKTLMVLDTSKHIEHLWQNKLIVLDQNPMQIGYVAAEQLYAQVSENAPIKMIHILEKFTEINN